jgi:Ni2+-binding GTPase involved in maturation of urease and hydrogenase
MLCHLDVTSAVVVSLHGQSATSEVSERLAFSVSTEKCCHSTFHSFNKAVQRMTAKSKHLNKLPLELSQFLSHQLNINKVFIVNVLDDFLPSCLTEVSTLSN